MPKRKVSDNEEDDFQSEDASESSKAELSADSDVQPLAKSKATSKKKQTSQKTDELPASKKSKKNGNGSTSEAAMEPTDGKVQIHTNGEGDKYIDLGKKKRAVVRSFKGISLVDIREYYGADGEEKPGKKGISLTLDQWKMLREGSSAIDKLFADQKQK